MIERRHHRQASRRRFGFCASAAIGGGGAGKDHLGAKGLGAFDFDGRSGRGHDDDSRRAERARRERHGLAVIAG